MINNLIKKAKFAKLFLPIYLFSGLASACTPSQSLKQDLADEVIQIFISEMNTKEQMKMRGKGGAMMQEIETFFFDYACPKISTLEETREVILRCISNFLDIVNNNKEIRPFLEHYPFSCSGLELIITFYPHEPCNLDSSSVFIDEVSLKNGIISYWRFETCLQKIIKIHKETYEEALEKVSQSSL